MLKPALPILIHRAAGAAKHMNNPPPQSHGKTVSSRKPPNLIRNPDLSALIRCAAGAGLACAGAQAKRQRKWRVGQSPSAAPGPRPQRLETAKGTSKSISCGRGGAQANYQRRGWVGKGPPAAERLDSTAAGRAEGQNSV